MKVLDWCPLLKIRQHLDVISRTCMVWMSQYHQYAAQRIRPPRLEEPLESYSAEDMERWVSVRRSADAGWKCEDLKLARSRWINHPGVGASCIVPGGRWLLVGDRYCGSVTTYDLDASTLTRRPLIPRDDQDMYPVGYIVINVDSEQQSSNLTFTMALSPVMCSKSSPLKIHIWRVTLTGHNTEARLIANRLCSFQAHDYSFIDGVAMHKNLFARIV